MPEAPISLRDLQSILFKSCDLIVPDAWTDMNGHMNEARYVEVAAKATDALLDYIGAGQDYVATQKSYFTAESHVRFLAEAHAGDHLVTMTRVLQGAPKTLHLFHTLFRSAAPAQPVATVETLLVHVDLKSRRGCLPSDDVANAVASLRAEHEKLPLPQGLGRHVGQRP
ncbi:hypothetical protein NBRC116601_07590 [Cognatishimia sp. WU-CL00825]|uniref:thioesterase family protein n=1 Tax=Cognatishimia sp. WU-CL00825 TaxID=3127658 RepID=UPI003105698A